jgi:hypothetical protein
MQIPPGAASASSRAATFHTVAEDVVLLSDHVAEVDANTELDALGGRDSLIARGHSALQLNGTPHRLDDAGKFRQEAVAGVLYYPAPCAPQFSD